MRIIKNTVEETECLPENIRKTGISLSVDFNGDVFNKNIDDIELSGLSETVFNNIESDMDEYGEAISAQERIALLLKLLRNELSKM